MTFILLRAKGWSWLLDTERVHEAVGCAIVNNAHIVVTEAACKRTDDYLPPINPPKQTKSITPKEAGAHTNVARVGPGLRP